jgi:hypothetical protein
MAYLKGKSSMTGLLRQELKLRAAKRSSDPKKIVEALSQLPGVEVATTRIAHLEDKDIFGSTKRKLGLLPSDDGNSHRPDKVKFLQPQVQTTPRIAHTKFIEASVAHVDQDELPHATTTIESNCDMSSGTLLGSQKNSIVNAMSNRQPPRSGALLGLPRAPKVLLLQHTVVGKVNMVAAGRLSQIFGFSPMTSSAMWKGIKHPWIINWPWVPNV